VAELPGLRLALATFTIFPARPARVSRRIAAASMVWCPLVGAALAGLASALLVGARLIYTGPTFYLKGVHVQVFEAPLLASALAITCLALLTRGLHLDGLADTVDGLASQLPAEDALTIMSAGPVGALGAAAMMGCLLVEVVALSASVLAHHGTQSLIFAVVTGRLAMLWSCTKGVPAARESGMGALVAGSVARPMAWLWTIVVLAGAGVYGRYDSEVGSVAGAIRGVAGVLIALFVAWMVRRHIVRRLGGITGDVLGALCEIATLASLLITAIGPH
jgi:adenosylcobinamide-GDP ribazoletransferase